MNWDTLSFKARTAVEEAIDTAREYGHSDIICLHLLQALLNQVGGVLTGFLHVAGGEHNQVRASVENGMDQLPRLAGNAGAVGVSQEFDALISRGWRATHTFGDDRLGPEHLIFAMVEARANQAGAILREQRLSVFLVTCCLLKWRQSQSDHFA